jgi:hypothetical protein
LTFLQRISIIIDVCCIVSTTEKMPLIMASICSIRVEVKTYCPFIYF